MLAVGTTYRFGVAFTRESGTGDLSDSKCDIVVEINNRNPPSSPLRPQGP